MPPRAADAGAVDASHQDLPACTNAACTDANGGSASVCVKETGRCVQLAAAGCSAVQGPYTDDDALVLATFDPAWEAAVLAASELSAAPASGDGQPKPLVLLRCSYDDANPDPVLSHLLDELRLPAIIAPFPSEYVAAMAPRVTAAGVLLLAAGSGAPGLTTIDDAGLLWRLARSQAGVVPALAQVLREVAAELPEAESPAQIVVLASESLIGNELKDALLAELAVEAAPGVLQVVTYPMASTATAAGFASIADAVIAHAPRIVVSVSSGETLGVVTALEQLWTRQDYRPEYVISGNGRDAFWLPLLPADSVGRVRGSYYVDRTASFASYVTRYDAMFSSVGHRSTGHNTYDAVYLLAYAHVAAGAQGAVTGRSLADAIARLVGPGPELAVGPPNIARARSLLAAGESIDLQGTSGDLDFDLSLGEPATVDVPVQTFCVSGSGANAAFRDAVQLYDPASKSLQGAFTCSD